MPMLQEHAFGRDGGRHHRQTVAHGLVDLALDTGTAAQGCQIDAAGLQERLDRGHVAVHDHIAGAQACGVLGTDVADQVQHHARQQRTQQRHDVLAQPVHRLAVGMMLVATDKQQVPGLVEIALRGGHVMHVGQHRKWRLHATALQVVQFGLADHGGGIGAGHQCQLFRTHTLGFTPQPGIVLQFGCALQAYVVQVDGVEDDARAGKGTQQMQMAPGDMMAGQQHRIHQRAMGLQPLIQPRLAGRTEHLDAEPGKQWRGFGR